jgi:hypothetical protein
MSTSMVSGSMVLMMARNMILGLSISGSFRGLQMERQSRKVAGLKIAPPLLRHYRLIRTGILSICSRERQKSSLVVNLWQS